MMDLFIVLVGIITAAVCVIGGLAFCFACEMAAWDAEDENG